MSKRPTFTFTGWLSIIIATGIVGYLGFFLLYAIVAGVRGFIFGDW